MFYTWVMQAAEKQVVCRSDNLQDLASTTTYLEVKNTVWVIPYLGNKRGCIGLLKKSSWETRKGN